MPASAYAISLDSPGYAPLQGAPREKEVHFSRYRSVFEVDSLKRKLDPNSKSEICEARRMGVGGKFTTNKLKRYLKRSDSEFDMWKRIMETPGYDRDKRRFRDSELEDRDKRMNRIVLSDDDGESASYMMRGVYRGPVSMN